MKNLDRKKPLENGKKRLQLAIDSLEKVGYQIYEEGEDTLAFYLPFTRNQKDIEVSNAE